MNRIFKIAAIPLILLLFTAEQCGEPGEIKSQENLLDSQKNEIRSNLESEFLSESVLFDQEISAKQKLADLADYLRILTDTSLQKPFREKAAEMVRKCFISDSCDIELITGPGERVQEMKTGILIEKGLHNQLPGYNYNFDSIKVEKSFQRVQEELYSTSLGFVQVPDKYTSEDQPGNSLHLTVTVLLSKGIKVIGSDTLSVWEMYFGNME